MVKFHGCATVESDVVIVMNLVDGSNLDKMLFGKQSVKVSLSITLS